MKAEIKANWIAALRSGEYKQETGTLYSKESGGFCCLGVLAKVTDLTISSDGACIMVNGKREDYDPLEALIGEQEEHLVEGTGGFKYYRPAISNLYSMNDDGEHTFPMIADWIEANIQVSES